MPLAILLIALVLCALPGEAPAGEDRCRTYTVQFNKPIEAPQAAIISGRDVAGDIPRDIVFPTDTLTIRIKGRFTRRIQKSTMLYVSGDVLYLYDLWMTGEELMEGEPLRGFSSKFGMFLQEIRLFGRLLLNKGLSMLPGGNPGSPAR
jgi:hypothetical protein